MSRGHPCSHTGDWVGPKYDLLYPSLTNDVVVIVKVNVVTVSYLRVYSMYVSNTHLPVGRLKPGSKHPDICQLIFKGRFHSGAKRLRTQPLSLSR